MSLSLPFNAIIQAINIELYKIFIFHEEQKKNSINIFVCTRHKSTSHKLFIFFSNFSFVSSVVCKRGNSSSSSYVTWLIKNVSKRRKESNNKCELIYNKIRLNNAFFRLNDEIFPFYLKKFAHLTLNSQ